MNSVHSNDMVSKMCSIKSLPISHAFYEILHRRPDLPTSEESQPQIFYVTKVFSHTPLGIQLNKSSQVDQSIFENNPFYDQQNPKCVIKQSVK